jgi:two-component system cell cycle sensor histidine kinase/response regulator CckA
MNDHGARGQALLRTMLEREMGVRALTDPELDGIVITRNGIIVEISDALLELSGYTRSDVIGRTAMDFIAPEVRETVGQRIAAAIEVRLDTIAMTRSGQRRQIAVMSRSHVVAGRMVRLTALRDVTEARRLEFQLKEAQRIEALARLTSGVAHDFNNVLLVIRFFAEMLLENLDKPHRHIAREILRAADSGAALTRLLLAYAREEPVAPHLLNLNNVVRGSERLLQYMIGDSVRLVLELTPDIANVQADATQLQQVILNLGINARDAMPQGGTLTLQTRNVEFGAADDSARRDQRSGRYATLRVIDSGVGVSKAVKARMFEPFFSTKEPGKGTGLGLAIVQEIVERCGGFIEVTSAAGAGTTFSIHLPQVEANR